MIYSINLGDWMGKKNDIGLAILLQPVVDVDPDNTININKQRVDETAVPLICDEERAAAIVKIIRKKFKSYEFRCYQSRTGNGGWKRV